jgi:hypothetical protein
VDIDFQKEVKMHIKNEATRRDEDENPRGEMNILFTLLDYFTVSDFVKLKIISKHSGF